MRLFGYLENNCLLLIMVALDLDLNNLSPGTKQGTISIVQALYKHFTDVQKLNLSMGFKLAGGT